MYFELKAVFRVHYRPEPVPMNEGVDHYSASQGVSYYYLLLTQLTYIVVNRSLVSVIQTVIKKRVCPLSRQTLLLKYNKRLFKLQFFQDVFCFLVMEIISIGSNVSELVDSFIFLIVFQVAKSEIPFSMFDI